MNVDMYRGVLMRRIDVMIEHGTSGHPSLDDQVRQSLGDLKTEALAADLGRLQQISGEADLLCRDKKYNHPGNSFSGSQVTNRQHPEQ